ncbi:MAG: hypothetical protein IBX72_14135 [Nitrospirae bacterium]|nr:hypothetical protein [Nitrospirota bacterium]
MWNGKTITTPAELYIHASNAKALEGKHSTSCCGLCSRPDEKGHRIQDTFGPKYGELSLLGSNADGICSRCKIIISDQLRKTNGTMLWYESEKKKGHLYFAGKTQHGKNKIHINEKALEFLIKPPRGYFMIAFNRDITGKNGTHFIPFGVVNYNDGSCDKYFLSVWKKVILMDIGFAKKYISAVRATNKKTYNIFYRNSEVMKEMLRQTSIEDIVGNFGVVQVVNRFVSINRAKNL